MRISKRESGKGRETDSERGGEKGERGILSLSQENDTLGFPGGRWLRLRASTAEGMGSIPGRGTPHMPQGAAKTKKERK